MDRMKLAVVELDRRSRARWMVFTIIGKEVIGVDTNCDSFCEIVDKYGPIPVIPLPRELSEGLTGSRLAE